MIHLDINSREKEYKELFRTLNVQDVFHIGFTDDETVIRRIGEYTPDGHRFSAVPINPGTSLYTMYGDGHYIVTENTMFQEPQ